MTSLLAQAAVSSAGAAVEKTTDSLTRDLYKTCQAAGWPLNIVVQLRVQMDAGKYCIYVPKGIENEVYTLEYGNGTQKEGSHILFTFLNNLHSTNLDEEMFKGLMRVGLV